MKPFKTSFLVLVISAASTMVQAQATPAPKATPLAPVKCELKEYYYTAKNWKIEIDDAKVLGGKPASFSLTYEAQRGVDGDGRDVPQTKAVAKIIEAYSGPRNNVYAFDAYVLSMNPETGEATVYAPWNDNYTLTCTAQKQVK